MSKGCIAKRKHQLWKIRIELKELEKVLIARKLRVIENLNFLGMPAKNRDQIFKI